MKNSHRLVLSLSCEHIFFFVSVALNVYLYLVTWFRVRMGNSFTKLRNHPKLNMRHVVILPRRLGLSYVCMI